MSQWTQETVGRIVRLLLVSSIYFCFGLLFWPFAKAILFAILFAFALNPVLQKIKNIQTKIENEKLLVLGLVNGLVGLFFIPLILVTISGVTTIKSIKSNGVQNSSLFLNIEDTLARLTQMLQQFSSDYGFNLTEQLDLKSKAIYAGEKVFGFLTAVVTQLPWFLFQFTVFSVTLYFILINKEFFKKWFVDLNIFSEKQVGKLSGLFESTCHLVLVSSVLVSTVQALIISIACLIAGYNDFLLIFMIAFFMSFIPVVGSAPVSVSLIVYSFFQGQLGAGIVLLVSAILAAVSDNVIRTYMMSQNDDNSTHPLVSLLSLIGAMSVFGFLGLFIGPIVTELAFKVSHIVHVENETVKKETVEKENELVEFGSSV